MGCPALLAGSEHNDATVRERDDATRATLALRLVHNGVARLASDALGDSEIRLRIDLDHARPNLSIDCSEV